MSDSRIVTIRKSANLDSSQISLPFSFINPAFGYSVETILRDIYLSPDCVLKQYAFPYDIQEYYWIQNGEPGKKEWYALGSLKSDGFYFFYRAYTYNTFDKSGHMDLWVSQRFSDLIQYAMDRLTYNIYITDTI